MLTSKKKCHTDAFVSVLILIFTFYIIFFFSDVIAEYTIKGLHLCYTSIIGAVFPFLILTDFIIAYTNFENIKPITRIFEKLFKINGYGILAFMCGSLCGYTVGVKVAAQLYDTKAISKDEFERLISFCNNVSPTYAIMGIGYSMRGSIKDGVILYLSALLSSILIGMLMNIKQKKSSSTVLVEHPKFNFINSVKSAASTTIQICAFIIFFSAVSGTVNTVINNKTVCAFILALTEVGNAAKIFSNETVFSDTFSLIATAFSVSFSGFCVHMQVKSILTDEEISMKKYYKAKILQGILAGIITAILIKI